MLTLFFSSLGTLRSTFQFRSVLQLEILALRHQINVLRRSQRGRVRVPGLPRGEAHAKFEGADEASRSCHSLARDVEGRSVVH